MALCSFIGNNCRNWQENVQNQRHKAHGRPNAADLSRKPRHLPVIMKRASAQTAAAYTIPHTILLRPNWKVKKNSTKIQKIIHPNSSKQNIQMSVDRAVVRSASKGPLVQRGLSNRPLEADLTGGLSLFAIPPTKIKDFGHLPLHKGGSRYALHLHDKLQFLFSLFYCIPGHKTRGIFNPLRLAAPD